MEIIGLVFWTAVKATIGYVLMHKGLDNFFRLYLIIFGIILNIPIFLIGIPLILAFGIGFIIMGLAVIDYFAIKYGGAEGKKRREAGLPLWPWGKNSECQSYKEGRFFKPSFYIIDNEGHKTTK